MHELVVSCMVQQRGLVTAYEKNTSTTKNKTGYKEVASLCAQLLDRNDEGHPSPQAEKKYYPMLKTLS